MARTVCAKADGFLMDLDRFADSLVHIYSTVRELDLLAEILSYMTFFRIYIYTARVVRVY